MNRLTVVKINGVSSEFGSIRLRSTLQMRGDSNFVLSYQFFKRSQIIVL